MNKIDQMSRKILRNILIDFKNRSLSFNELDKGYEGVSLEQMRSSYSGELKVMFDIAFKKLEENKLIKTGPLVPIKNNPGDIVFVVGMENKRQYAYLTTKGYEAAIDNREIDLSNKNPINSQEELLSIFTTPDAKVYLDTNVICRTDFKIKEEDSKALARISERYILHTSEKSKREIDKTPNDIVKGYLTFIYNLIKKIPEKNLIVWTSGSLGSSPFGSSPLGGGGSQENPVFTKLKTVFDVDDAEHVFQAVQNNFDYFLTLDRKTILNRRSMYNKLGLKTKIVSPVDLEKILFAVEDNIE